MEIQISILLLIIGNLIVAEGRIKAHQILNYEEPDVETARELNAKFEKIIEESWARRTISPTENDDCTPYFFSKTYNSTIIGKYMNTINNRQIYAFQGFRYATAERFLPPKPVDKFWADSYFMATHIGFKCPQGAYIGDDPSGNEDCLFLNVYTPYNPEDIITQKLPVMLFIHGGAYTGGDAAMYLPTRLLDYDVILVTIHYRLGAFGFFTLDTPEAPGNMALYDMVAALNWTQTYISDFGGDPDKVTIFGESAGSVSVNYMMIVEPARGMFRAVIAESGSCLDHWAIDLAPEQAARLNADYVGCYDTETDTIDLDCMKNVSAAELVRAQGHLVGTDRHNGLMGFRGVAPTIQTFDPDDLEFPLILTKLPKEYFMENDFEKVPFMTGANKQEGSYVAGIMYHDYLQYNNLSDNATYMREQSIPDILLTLGIEDDTHSLATSLQMLYCPDIDLANGDDAFPCIIDLLGPLFLKGGSWQVANYHSYYSNRSTYYYSFEFESDDTMLPYIVGSVPFDGGITHADELMYIFDFPAVMDPGPQMITEQRMVRLWTNFAIYLNPTPEDQKDNLTALGIPTWTPYRFEDHHVLVIADTLFVDTEYSNRWTITVDELRSEQQTTTEGNMEETCTGQCADYKDQRDTFEAVMITFIVLFVVVDIMAAYFFFKARRS